MHFAKKQVREMSENVWLFDAVNGAGIVNGNSEFFLFLIVRFPHSMHQYQAYGLYIHTINKEHSLGTSECHANGMLVLPIFF